MNQNKPTKQRKPSWECLDLAYKIDVGARHYASKLVLLFLAKTVNESLKTYHGYRSISAHTGLTHEAIRKATVRLRDIFKILTWKRGKGGSHESPDTNDYKLNLAAMKSLVKQQGVFNVDTGRLLKYEVPPQPSEEGNTKVTYATEQGTYATEQGTYATEQGTSPTQRSKTLGESNPQIKKPSERPTLGPSSDLLEELKQEPGSDIGQARSDDKPVPPKRTKPHPDNIGQAPSAPLVPPAQREIENLDKEYRSLAPRAMEPWASARMSEINAKKAELRRNNA